MSRYPAHLRILPGAVFAVVLAGAARAHDGPPYPILVDQPLVGHQVSIWADPDVGIGTFFIYVEPAEGALEALLPLRIHARPHDPQLGESTCEVVAAEDAPYQLIAEIAFADRGWWTTRFVHAASGETLTVEVEVTPPGSFGPIDMLWFLSPFLAVGLLWVKGVLRQRAHDRAHRESSP